MKEEITIEQLKKLSPKEAHKIDWELYNDISKIIDRFHQKLLKCC